MAAMQFRYETVIPNEDLPFRMFIFEGKNGNYKVTKHWHQSVEIFLVLEGSIDFYINSIRNTLCSGDFVIVNSNEIHSIECPNPNVTIVCTCENQQTADQRLPVLLSLPIRHREIIHEPMLEEIQIRPYLETGKIEQVTCGGESGEGARLCRYEWVLSTRKQCMDCGVAFSFHQTGANFQKDGRIYRIPRSLQHSQAKRAGLDYQPSRLPKTKAQMEELFQRLSASEFRSRFSLSPKLKQYVLEKGEDTLRRHAQDFIRTRLAPAQPEHDGKQTPMKGHPVFLAQHATACCCRGCLEKWYGVSQGRPLTREEQEQIVEILMEWIRRKMK